MMTSTAAAASYPGAYGHPHHHYLDAPGYYTSMAAAAAMSLGCPPHHPGAHQHAPGVGGVSAGGGPPRHMDFQTANALKMHSSFAPYGSNAFEGYAPVLELRKEKSRDAARSRRGKENYEFYELAKMLPLPSAITSQLDKASIVRLTISYLKLKDFSCHGDPPWQDNPKNKGRNRRINFPGMELFEVHQGTHILQSLDGFAFSLSNDGRFLYISETVSIYLGLSQVEMTGSSVFDYVHVGDHQELAEHLGLQTPHAACGNIHSPSHSDEGSNSRAHSPSVPERTSIMNPSVSKGYERSFCIRMKSTLTKRGVHVKCAGYRVVQILARMRPQVSFNMASRKHPPPILGLVALAIALPPPTITELVIDSDMFVSRLSPEFNITYIEPRISDMMDITVEDITNKNLYDYCHAEDLQKLSKAHSDLLAKGQVLTDYYRLMNKHGGYVWLQTCATIICNNKNVEEQNIIAINYVLSGIEYPGCVMNMNQYRTVMNGGGGGGEPDPSDNSETEHGGPDKENNNHGAEPSPPSSSSPPRQTDSGGNMLTLQPPQHSSPLDLLYRDTSDPAGAAHSASSSSSQLFVSTEDMFSSATDPRKDLKNNDGKFSRRKMDKPRKRKRGHNVMMNDSDNDGGGDGGGVGDLTSGVTSTADALETILHEVETGGAGGDKGQSPPAQKLRCHLPEDLSLKSGGDDGGEERSNTLASVVNSSGWSPPAIQPSNNDESPQINNSSAESSSSIMNLRNNTVHGGGMETGNSSVRDLEEVMNKHLPASSGSSGSGSNNDQGDYQKQKSAIQWIGANNTSTSGGGVLGPDGLPATNLLRSLYASRESVIRSNVYNPRPQYSHYNASGTTVDNSNMQQQQQQQNSLLTPPSGGNGGNNDMYSNKTPPHSSCNSTSTNSTGVGGYYATSPPLSVAPTHLVDTYSITPPSSVSPQDKYPVTSAATGSIAAAVAGGGGGGYEHYIPGLSDSLMPHASSMMKHTQHAYPLPAHANPAASLMYDTRQYSGAYYNGVTGPVFQGYTPNPAHYRDSSNGGAGVKPTW